MEIEIFSSAELLGSAKLRSGRITARQPERVTGFFNAYRQGERVTRNRLRDIAQQFRNWLKSRCEKWKAPILDATDNWQLSRLTRLFLPGFKEPEHARRKPVPDARSYGSIPL